MPVKIKIIPIIKGKKKTQRKRDFTKLKKSFPNISIITIEKTYNDHNENIKETILSLNSFEIVPKNEADSIKKNTESFRRNAWMCRKILFKRNIL